MALRAMYKGIKKVLAPLIINRPGELAIDQDALNAELNKIYFPRSEEALLGAYNELPFPYTDSAFSAYGVTVTVDSDGVVTCSTEESGATANIFFMLMGNTITDKFNGLRIVGCPSGGAANKFSLEARVGLQSGDTYVTSATDVGNGAIIPNVDTSTQHIRIYIRIQSGTILTTPIKFKPMITRDLTATYADFQPYAMTNQQLTIEKSDKNFVAISGADLDDYKSNGKWRLNGSITHGPGPNYGFCVVFAYGTAVRQFVFADNSTAVYTRIFYNNAWTNWYSVTLTELT